MPKKIVEPAQEQVVELFVNQRLTTWETVFDAMTCFNFFQS